MSVSKWAYTPGQCDGDFCPGNCDTCKKRNVEVDEIEDAAALIVKASIDLIVHQGKDKFVLLVTSEHLQEFTMAAKWLGLDDRCIVQLDEGDDDEV